jgi:hypothetical protein
MVQISEVKGMVMYDELASNGIGTARENRVAAHSHIRGLGLREDGIAEQTAAGFIGQQQAREVRHSPFCVLNSGMRCCRRPDQVQENGWSRNVVGGRLWHWKDSPSARCCTGIRPTSPILSDRWKRSIQYGNQED